MGRGRPFTPDLGVPKKRGRPRKDSQAVNESSPKKRGRPRKQISPRKDITTVDGDGTPRETHATVEEASQVFKEEDQDVSGSFLGSYLESDLDNDLCAEVID